ncbi:response regulator [Flavobacterium sp.]|jgi:DNA-binding NarL/FixJ family response regulator|uniref:response regulator n=1 Tax=Flavobacterium sp. TaxID=239 RepID=UPI0037C00498
MIKILLVEDNLFLQKALEEKLSFFPDVIIKDTAQNGEEAIVILEKNHVFDLILMDIEMPKMNGIKATEIIKSKYPQIKIVMITVYDNDDNIFNAIKAGADGYLLKETQAEKIYEAIGETLSGGAAMSPSIAMKTLKLLKNPGVFEDPEAAEGIELSVREIEVLEQLSKGLKNKDIADNLFISFSTVKKHIENIYKKLQAHNRIELIQKARNNKLI